MKDYLLKKDEKWAVYLEPEDGACENGWWVWDGEWLYPEWGKPFYRDKEDWYQDAKHAGVLWGGGLDNYDTMAEQLICEGLLPWDTEGDN